MTDFLSRQLCWAQITNAGDRMTESSCPVLVVVEGHAFETHFEGERGLQKSGEAHNAWGEIQSRTMASTSLRQTEVNALELSSVHLGDEYLRQLDANTNLSRDCGVWLRHLSTVRTPYLSDFSPLYHFTFSKLFPSHVWLLRLS